MPSRELARYCILENTPEQRIFIRFYVSEKISTGGEFKIFAEDKKKVLEQWKMVAKDGQKYQYELDLPFKHINKTYVAWTILYCTSVPSMKNAKFKMEVYQGDKKCKFNHNLEWEFDNAVPCSIKMPDKLSGNFMFVVKS